MYKHLLLLFLIAGVLIGCKKNELKKPADVSFTMDINRSPSSEGHLIFTSGTILISEFDVEGERQEGEPIAFSKEFPEGLSINFSETGVISDLVFDIPQGNYQSLDISFSTFDDNDDITILVNGTYTNESDESFPLRYEFLSSEYFSISGEADSGGDAIILDKDVPVVSLIKFDPIYWFDIISDSEFEDADLVNVDGQMTLLINEDYNEDIYDKVADRIDETTRATFGN